VQGRENRVPFWREDEWVLFPQDRTFRNGLPRDEALALFAAKVVHLDAAYQFGDVEIIDEARGREEHGVGVSRGFCKRRVDEAL